MGSWSVHAGHPRSRPVQHNARGDSSVTQKGKFSDSHRTQDVGQRTVRVTLARRLQQAESVSRRARESLSQLAAPLGTILAEGRPPAAGPSPGGEVKGMRTSLVSMAASIALLGSGFAGAQGFLTAPGRLAVFKAGVDVVNLAVTVSDPKGRFVTDLAESDFEVLEEGVRQPLTIFTREDLPVSLAILIDTSASMDTKLAQAQTAAIRFVKTLHPADEAQVVQFSRRAEVVQDFTSDKAQLEAAIRSTHASGDTALYTAIYVALKD